MEISNEKFTANGAQQRTLSTFRGPDPSTRIISVTATGMATVLPRKIRTNGKIHPINSNNLSRFQTMDASPYWRWWPTSRLVCEERQTTNKYFSTTVIFRSADDYEFRLPNSEG